MRVRWENTKGNERIAAEILAKYSKKQQSLSSALDRSMNDLLGYDIITKKVIISVLQDAYGSVTKGKVDRGDVEKAIEVLFREMSTALTCGDRLEIRGFVTMTTKKKGCTNDA